MQKDHVSIDEAVARLLNMDFVPAPYTVMELLEGFLLQAQEQYERIPSGTGNLTERNSHYAAMKVCQSRLDLGKVLLEAMESEIKRGNLIAKSTTSSVQPLSWSAISSWAEAAFGLSVFERVVAPQAKPKGDESMVFDDDPVTVLDKELAGWKHKKLRYLLETFYALLYDVAYRHQASFLNADRSVKVSPLAEEVEGIVKKYAGSTKAQYQTQSAIKDRLEIAEKVWFQALERWARNGK